MNVLLIIYEYYLIIKLFLLFNYFKCQYQFSIRVILL